MAPVAGDLRRPPFWHFDAVRGPSTPSVGGLFIFWNKTKCLLLVQSGHSLIDSMHVGSWNVTLQRMLPNMTSERIVPVILIVEDEALVRLSAVGMLEDAGFRMIEAVNSDQALELLAADSDVQLLFTDVNMPGTIDGLALARRVHDRWPHIGILVASAKRAPQPEEL